MAPTIQALHRGMLVLDTLTNGVVHSPLSQLHRRTGIHKSTLLAILNTFAADGIVEETPEGWGVKMVWLLRIQTCSIRHLVEIDRRRSFHAQEEESPQS